MELKLGMVINSQEVIQKLSEGALKAKVAWRIAGIVKAMEEPVNRFNEFRNDLIKKYGEESEEGITINPESEGYIKFINELNEVALEDVTLNIKKISIDDIEDIEIQVNDLMKIEWMIED